MVNQSSEYLKYWRRYDKHRNYLGKRMVGDRNKGSWRYSSSSSRMSQLGPDHIPRLTLSFRMWWQNLQQPTVPESAVCVRAQFPTCVTRLSNTLVQLLSQRKVESSWYTGKSVCSGEKPAPLQPIGQSLAVRNAVRRKITLWGFVGCSLSPYPMGLIPDGVENPQEKDPGLLQEKLSQCLMK